MVLRPGNDLLVLARDAIDRGADVIGMAGGDGSQALVASIAAERGVPMVVIPAGTRNHLALDLGIDRDDVVGALDAFGEAVERPMDLAEVNGHVFVNNVSLGLYAAIVQSSEYRDAKVDTTLSALPKLLGPGSHRSTCASTDRTARTTTAPTWCMVSNGPYGSTLATMATRARIDTGSLGVFSLVIPDDAAAKRFLAALATNRPDRYEGYDSWSETDVRHRLRKPGGSGSRRGSDGDGTPAAVLHPPARAARASRARCHRLLARGPRHEHTRLPPQPLAGRPRPPRRSHRLTGAVRSRTAAVYSSP